MALRHFSDLAVLNLLSQKSNKSLPEHLKNAKTIDQNGVKHRSHAKIQTWPVQSSRSI